MTAIPALERLRKEDPEFKDGLGYTVSSRQACATQCKTLPQKTKTKNK
jgi:hypothetical protein